MQDLFNRNKEKKQISKQNRGRTVEGEQETKKDLNETRQSEKEMQQMTEEV